MAWTHLGYTEIAQSLLSRPGLASGLFRVYGLFFFLISRYNNTKNAKTAIPLPQCAMCTIFPILALPCHGKLRISSDRRAYDWRTLRHFPVPLPNAAFGLCQNGTLPA